MPVYQRLAEEPQRPVGLSIRRGLMCRCPNCGEGRAFNRFLKVAPQCESCGEDLSHHRADDAPPYFTILLVGHLLVPIMLAFHAGTSLSDAAFLAIWLPIFALATILLLQPIKGAVVGLQWALRMHGFDGKGGEEFRPEGVAGAA